MLPAPGDTCAWPRVPYQRDSRRWRPPPPPPRCEAAAALFLRLRLVHGQPASFEFLLIEFLARGAPGGAVRHFDEAETAGLPGGVIADQLDRRDVAKRGEERLELLLIGMERQIAYIKSHDTSS